MYNHNLNCCTALEK